APRARPFAAKSRGGRGAEVAENAGETWHARNPYVIRLGSPGNVLAPRPYACGAELDGAAAGRATTGGRRIRRADRQPKGAKPLMPADRWYAVWTKSHCERLVAEQLSAKGFAAFLPEMPMRSRRQGKSHFVQMPMFPGYLFLRHAMEKASYVEILKARGIV